MGKNPLVWLALGIIIIYQYVLSPLFGPRCRFYPSCSHYAVHALKTHGLLKGGYLALWRILRCHPGSTGGFDPVPEKGINRKKSKKRSEYHENTMAH